MNDMAPFDDMSERVKFILAWLYTMAAEKGDFDLAMAWFYFGLKLAVVDPMAMIQTISELEELEGWTDDFMDAVTDTVKLAVTIPGKGTVVKQEALA